MTFVVTWAISRAWWGCGWREADRQLRRIARRRAALDAEEARWHGGGHQPADRAPDARASGHRAASVCAPRGRVIGLVPARRCASRRWRGVCRPGSQEATMATTLEQLGARTAPRWWALGLRGLAAIILGILSFAVPGLTFLALVIAFGCYALVDGAISVATAGAGGVREPRWASIIARGVASIVAGLLALLWPGMTALVLLLEIAGWALVSGIFEVATAIRLRRQVPRVWIYVLTGILSVAFGVVLFISPLAGAIALGLWVGAYALVFGIALLVSAFRLRSVQHHPLAA
jgi:uncharacterized membrane protein HdeD (DUF308 family)